MTSHDSIINKNFLLVLIFIIHIFFQSITFGKEIVENKPYRAYDSSICNACGAINLYLGLRLMDIEVDINDVMVKCEIDENGKTDFLKMANAAKSYGIHSLPVKMNIEALKNMNSFAILQIQTPKDHFILFHKKGNMYELLDGTNINNVLKTDVSLQELNKRWKGYALLLSKSPINIESKYSLNKVIHTAIIIGLLLGIGTITYTLNYNINKDNLR